MKAGNQFKKIHQLPFKRILILVMIFLLGVGLGYSFFINSPKFAPLAAQAEKNTPKAFLSETYDKIKDNYWDNLSDAQLIDLFRLAVVKNGGQPLGTNINSKDKLIDSIEDLTKGQGLKEQHQFVVNILSAVISSLNPAGRSGLYTQKQEVELKNIVENVNPQKDLYKDLGLNKGASPQAVNEAYNKKEQELKKDNTPQAQEQLKQIAYAKDVLTTQDQKQRYDQKGVEPTIFTKVIGPGILYFQFKKFSPSSYDEFIKAFESYKNDLSLSTLIFDLRGNVGGAIDATAYFLGHFIGLNQYAFDFYHKGEYVPFKTPTNKLASISKYKQVVILVDNQTQSSAEMMVAAFKKYHLGVVVGLPTKGWGTVERIFPLDNQIDQETKYSLFLVHSITLRDDNLPIEGRGVEPDINIKDPNWEQQLFSYFRNPALTAAVRQTLITLQ